MAKRSRDKSWNDPNYYTRKANKAKMPAATANSTNYVEEFHSEVSLILDSAFPKVQVAHSMKVRLNTALLEYDELLAANEHFNAIAPSIYSSGVLHAAIVEVNGAPQLALKCNGLIIPHSEYTLNGDPAKTAHDYHAKEVTSRLNACNAAYEKWELATELAKSQPLIWIEECVESSAPKKGARL